VDTDKREYTFAQTFPTGTHAMWIIIGSRPMALSIADVKAIVVPPPQMVANMRVGNMDGFCVGEPWAHARFSTTSVHGRYHAGYRKDHPEKYLAHAPSSCSRSEHRARDDGGILEASNT